MAAKLIEDTFGDIDSENNGDQRTEEELLDFIDRSVLNQHTHCITCIIYLYLLFVRTHYIYMQFRY